MLPASGGVIAGWLSPTPTTAANSWKNSREVDPKMRRTIPLLVVALLSAACAGTAYGQSAASATIVGTVLDPRGSTVPDAPVTAKNLDTGIMRETKTTSDGLYRFDYLPPGTYDVSVQASGFSMAIAKGVKLQVGDQKDLNFNLKLAGQQQVVEVTSEAPLVETTKTDASMVVSDAEMADLPVLDTNVTGISISHMNDYEGLASTAPGVKFDFTGNNGDLIGPGAYNNRGNLINVDGANITDQVVSTRDVLGASLDEVREFQVITNNYNAEYGQAGSIILNVITKSGTNSIHGSGRAFFRGRNLAASNYFYNAFNPGAATRRAPFQKQEWGVDLGGPFVKDRTFWYANFEKLHQEFPLNLINQPPDYTHSVTVSQPSKEILWTAKIDHEIVKNHHLMLRFNEDRQFNDNLLVQIAQYAEPGSLTFFGITDHTFNAALTSTVTTTVLNEARFVWHRFRNTLPDKSSIPGERGPNFYTGAAFCCPQGGLQHRFQYIDNITWIRGSHSVKVGTDISHFPYDSLFQQYHFGRYEGFAKATATNPPGPPGSSNPPTQFTVGFGPGFVHAADTIYGVYAQDSWRLRPNLTFNYGLRYDDEEGAFKGGTVPKPGGGCFEGNGIISACSSDRNNFQPRLGLAWSPRFSSGPMHWLFGDEDRSVVRISAAEVTELAYLNVVLDSLNFDGTTLLTQTITSSATGCNGTVTGQMVLSAFPNYPDPALLACFKPVNFYGRIRPISPNLHNPETRHLHLGITRQLGANWVVESGYIGVLGFGQFGERDLNFPAINPDPAHAGFFYLGPRPDSRFAAVRMNENSRTSAYHGGYVQLQKRFSHHFQVQGSYTLSKTLASTEDFYGTSEPGDPRNIGAERSLSQNDVRHLFNMSFAYETANLTDVSVLKPIVNNWNFGIVGTAQSGRPYPISTGEVPFAGTFYPGVGSESQQRPNVLRDGTLVATNIPSDGGLNLLVGPNGAVMCGCPQTTFLAPAGASPLGPVDSFSGDVVDFQFLNGNLARNMARTDPYYRFDLSLTKAFRISPSRENVRLELRADFINVLNHTNFQLFNGNDTLDLFSIGPAGCTSCIDDTTGFYVGSNGQPLKLQDLRHGRVSSNLANPLFAGVGDPTIADAARTIQLALRIKW